MSDTRIEITVSGENAAQTLEQIAAGLPAGAIVLPQEAATPTPAELIRAGIEASATLPADIAAWSSAAHASDALAPVLLIALCAFIFAVAYGVEHTLRRTVFADRSEDASPRVGGADRIGAAVRWGMSRLFGLVIFYVLSLVGISIMASATPENAALSTMLLSSFMPVRVWLTVIELLTGSRDASRRPTALSDPEAAHIMRSTLMLMVFIGVSALARNFVVSVVEAGDSGALFAISMRLIDSVAISVFFFAIRKPIGRLITGTFGGERSGTTVRLLARYWYVLYIALLALQIAAEARGYLSGTLGAEAAALKRSFGIFVLTPFLFAGLGIWRNRLVARKDIVNTGRIEGIFTLLEGALVIGAAITIMYAWNIDPFSRDLTGARRILPGLVSAAIMIVVGISAWRVISAFLVVRKGTPADSAVDPSDNEGGVGGSRIETVYPILRAFLSAMIGFITVLLALSSLGIQIAPLLAGAGVLGLAIGFGAQKVVEDVISGILYLVEDAFRIGEYIETGQGKGVVEAIMLRSVRLRHHRGPIFTIPFSAMGTIQNHSRDWVTVKLSFEVGPSEDLEKVRKLVKKIGVELEDDPEITGQFLAPLKSQGAVAMVGSNFKIGVKFTCEPGKQFLIRRKALNALQRAFVENNIEMASQRVMVDTLGQPASAAAAKTVIAAKTVAP